MGSIMKWFNDRLDRNESSFPSLSFMRSSPGWIGSRPVGLLLLLVLIYLVVLVDSRLGVTDAQYIKKAIIIHLI